MDKRLLWMSVSFFIVFLLFSAYVFFTGSITTLTRAAEDTAPSLQKSLIFAWPLKLSADGNTASKITVFIRNKNGKALEDQLVKITSTLGDIQEGQIPTDTQGEALFHISSDVIGVAEIEAFVDNRRLIRNITIKFE